MALSMEEDGRPSPMAADITGEDGVDPRWPGYHIRRELGDPDGIELDPADDVPGWPEC